MAGDGSSADRRSRKQERERERETEGELETQSNRRTLPYMRTRQRRNLERGIRKKNKTESANGEREKRKSYREREKVVTQLKSQSRLLNPHLFPPCFLCLHPPPQINPNGVKLNCQRHGSHSRRQHAYCPFQNTIHRPNLSPRLSLDESLSCPPPPPQSSHLSHINLASSTTKSPCPQHADSEPRLFRLWKLQTDAFGGQTEELRNLYFIKTQILCFGTRHEFLRLEHKICML